MYMSDEYPMWLKRKLQKRKKRKKKREQAQRLQEEREAETQGQHEAEQRGNTEASGANPEERHIFEVKMTAVVQVSDTDYCDPHISSHELTYWRVFPHIRRFLMLDFQAQKREAQRKIREAQLIAFRNRYFMKRMFKRLGQATKVLPPELFDSSDSD